MEAGSAVRVLWVGEGASQEGFPAGNYAVEVLPSVQGILRAVDRAEGEGRPFALAFLPWGSRGVDQETVADILHVSPGLFVVLEGAVMDLPAPVELSSWADPGRCIVLAEPVHPYNRKSHAEHFGARWQRESAERERVSRLESQARSDRFFRRRNEERLNVLYGIVERLHGSRRLDDSMAGALGEMSRFLGASTGSLLLLREAGLLTVLEAVGPNREQIVGIDIPLAQSQISRCAIEDRQPVLVQDMQSSQRFRESEDGRRFRARSILCVPLFSNGKPLGVLNFGTDAETASFTEQDRDLMVTLGRQVTVALEQGQLLRGLRGALDESIRALAGAIEAKDPYTRGHSDRVAHYSCLIAGALGLGRDEIDLIHRAAILHDVGKIGVPELVLNKPSRLDPNEFVQIQQHPLVGVEIVKEIGAMEDTLNIIRAHHERVDGSGYPDGAAGEDIPLGARILFVADTYDAMTSDRPYRKGLAPEVAYAEIKRCSGTQFDPEVGRVFLEGAPDWPDLQFQVGASARLSTGSGTFSPVPCVGGAPAPIAVST